jgi:hypothetical protein
VGVFGRRRVPADGLLDESLTLEFQVEPDPGTVDGFADLTGHDFAGTLDSQWSAGLLRLVVSYEADGSLNLAGFFADGGILAVIEPVD